MEGHANETVLEKYGTTFFFIHYRKFLRMGGDLYGIF